MLYDIGEKSEHFYFLHKGRVRIDSMFEVEDITKWPSGPGETEWNVHTKKVLRSLATFDAPQIIGHIDVLSN